MQKRKHPYSHYLWLLPVFIITIMYLFVTSSCSDSRSKSMTTGPTCVTLTAKQINDMWVTPGYTRSGSANQVTWLKLYTSYGGPGSNFAVNINGMKTDLSQAPDSKIDMAAGTGCDVTLPADIAIGSNSIDVSALDIFEADGSLKKNINYVKFTPQAFAENKSFMNYTVEVIYSTGSQAKGITLPCPPCVYCRPPCDTITN